MFLKSGDERIPNNIGNITFVDRGQGEFDHHGSNSHNGGNSNETSASKVADKLGLSDDPIIQKLLRHVELNDLRGLVQPFDVADIIKRAAHNSELGDKQRMELGLRIVGDVVAFRKLELERDHQFVSGLIESFLEKEKLSVAKLERYCQQLRNGKFSRDPDLVETLSAEKKNHGEDKARHFAETLLQIITQDERNFQKALAELKQAQWIQIQRGNILVIGHSSNPAFNKAARYKGATVIVQKSDIGIQIYFNFAKVKPQWVDQMMAVIRLEEQLIANSKPLITDFRILTKPERIREVKEWYYYVSSDQKGGRFILNRSLTAPDPDIPETKISLAGLQQIIQQILIMGDKFVFEVYAAKRINHF